MEIWTIQKLLNWVTQYFEQKAIESPRLRSEILLSSVLGLKRIELYTKYNQAVDRPDLDKLRQLVQRAGMSEPIAYLVGKTEFYSMEMDVTCDCLIPRPETELLVQRAIEFLRTRSDTQFVCDLCTGCGCIAAAIANNFADVRIIATDISDAALSAAAKNIERYKLDNKVSLLCGDLFEPVIPQIDTEKFDLIVSNPPYVSDTEFEKLDKNVKDYEPRLALWAGVDGLDVYRRIIADVDKFLKSDGALMMEIGYAQGPAVRQLLEEAGMFSEINIEKDFNNNDRIVTAKKYPAPEQEIL